MICENVEMRGETSDRSKLAASLAAFRNALGLSQAKMAEELNLKRDSIANWENGPVLLPVNPAHDQQEADGWCAIAVLVYVSWRDEDGGEVTFYRPEGIKPNQLLKYRA